MAAEIRILINSQNSSAGVAAAKKDIQELGESAKGAGGGFSALREIGVGALRAVGEAALNAGVAGIKAFVGYVSDSISAARESNMIMAQTEQVIKSTGGAAGVSAQHVADYASSLSAAAGKSLFGDEQVAQSANLLLTFTNIKGKALDAATAISVDMAQALGGAPKDAAIQLGKALNDPEKGITALTRVGVSFTEQQKEQIKVLQESGDMAGAQAIILKELNTEFGGSAEAAAKADGGWAQFHDRMGEVQETVGKAILPLLGQLAGFLNDTIAPAIETAAAAFSAWLADPATQAGLQSIAATISTVLSTAFDFIAHTAIPALITAWNTLQPAVGMVMGMFTQAGDGAGLLGAELTALGGVWNTIVGLIGALLPPIQTLIQAVFGAVAAFLHAHGDDIQAFLGSVWRQIAEIVRIAAELIKAIVIPVFTFIAGFITAHSAEIQTVLTATWNIIKAVIDAALTLIKGILTAALLVIHGDWEGAWETIKQTLIRVWEDIKVVVDSALTIVKTYLSVAWDVIKGTATTAWDGIKTAISTAWTNIKTAIDGTITTIKGAVSQAWEDIKRDAITAWEGIGTAIGKAFGGAVQYIKDKFNDIIDMMNNAIDSFNQLPGVHMDHIPRLAHGTDFFAGGPALVGEQGPELVYLPRGAAVVPLHQNQTSMYNQRAITINYNGVASPPQADYATLMAIAGIT